MLKIIKPDKKTIDLILPYVDEYREDDSPYKIFDVRNFIKYYDNNDINGYLESLKNNESGKLPNDWVNYTTYWLMNDNEHIGFFVIRHKLTPNLMKQGGNIAYMIAKSQRGKGYAFQGLKLCLQKLKEMGIEEALITCNADNKASFHIIQKALNLFGGRFLEEIEIDGHKECRVFIKTINA